jgi:hypothetical protein
LGWQQEQRFQPQQRLDINIKQNNRAYSITRERWDIRGCQKQQGCQKRKELESEQQYRCKYSSNTRDARTTAEGTAATAEILKKLD